MTKGELRAARKQAMAEGKPMPMPWTPQLVAKPKRAPRRNTRNASREEQYGRYIDCGPSNWDA